MKRKWVRSLHSAFHIIVGKLFGNRLVRKTVTSAFIAIVPAVFAGGVLDHPPDFHEEMPAMIYTTTESYSLSGATRYIGPVLGTCWDDIR
jgi:hypothetical protein